jgi:DNA-binding transcriptional LysR family regulator
MDPDERVSRRLKVSDLRLLHAVVQSGGMAKAAAQLNISQPAVSKAISALEYTLGVRLLDRNSRGVEPTPYGRALVRRGIAIFDELRQGVNDIRSLNDPAVGEIRLGATATMIETWLPLLINRFAKQYPRVVLHIDTVLLDATYMSGLRERKYDVMMARLRTPVADDPLAEDLREEPLFHDPLVLAVGRHNRWARRRKIDLAELVAEPWMLPAPSTWNYSNLMEAIKARGLEPPPASAVTAASNLRLYLTANGPYITSTPRSSVWLSPYRQSLKVLPVELPIATYSSVAAVTLRHRTLNPAVERFIAYARQIANSIVVPPRRPGAGSPAKGGLKQAD